MKKILPFSYNENLDEMLKILESKGYSTAEGSNGSAIASILAYAVSTLNLNTALNIRENIIHLAQKRENIIEDARMLGYEYRKKTSTLLKLKIQFKALGVNEIPKYTEFLVDGYSFYTMESYKFNNTSASDTFEIIVKEGNIISPETDPELMNYVLEKNSEYIDIPLKNIENNGIFINGDIFNEHGEVQRNIEFNQINLNSDISDLAHKKDNIFVRIDDLETNFTRVYFKYASLGRHIISNSVIRMTVLISSGKIDLENLKAAPKNFNSLNVIENAKIIRYGANEESNESIKNSAPVIFNARNRAVTGSDYISIIKSLKNINDANVWGGEDMIPNNPGHIFVTSFKDTDKIKKYYKLENKEKIEISDIQEYNKIPHIIDYDIDTKKFHTYYETDYEIVNTIFDSFKRKNLPALVYNYLHPIFLDFDVLLKIKEYPSNISNIELNRKIQAGIEKYFETRQKYNSSFTLSTLSKVIEDILGPDKGFDLKVNYGFDLQKINGIKTENQQQNLNTEVYFDTKLDSDNLEVIVYLTPLCLSSDTFKLVFNRPINNSNEVLVPVNEIKDSYVKKYNFSLKSVDAPIIRLKSDDKTYLGTDFNFYNIKSKKFYYVVTEGRLTEIKIILTRFMSIGDKLILFTGSGDKALKHSERFLNKEDIENGYFSFNILNLENLDTQRLKDFNIVFMSKYGSGLKQEEFNKKEIIFNPKNQILIDVLESFECLGSLARNIQIAEQETKNQDELLNGVIPNILLYDVKYEENIKIRVWTPSFANNGDELLINFANNETSTLIKKSEIFTDIILQYPKLEVKEFEYNGADSRIKMYKLSESETDLVYVGNSEVKIKSYDYKNIIDFSREVDNSGLVQPNQSSYTFYTNYFNELDIRNFVLNFKSGVSIDVNLTNTDLELKGYKLILNLPRKPKVINLPVTISYYDNSLIRREYIIKINIVDYKDDDNSSSLNGGIHLFLNEPIEGIYSGNQLDISLLPKINYTGYSDSPSSSNIENLYNFNESRNLDFKKTKKFKRFEIFVDFTINEETLRYIIPVAGTLENYNTLNARKIKRILFPIKIKEYKYTQKSDIIDSENRDNLEFYNINETEKIIGKYQINIINNKPVIFVRFENIFEVSKYLSLKYPSDNINFSKNLVPRLKSLRFVDVPENYYE